jgi:inosose dehydratase
MSPLATRAKPDVLLPDCPVGANPIIWSNDDFPELEGDVPLNTILREMRGAGYEGTELGHAYPRAPELLRASLALHGLRLASGWHSTRLVARDLADEVAAFSNHLQLLKNLGSGVVIVAECTRAIHGVRDAPLGYGETDRPHLSETEWPRFTSGLLQLVDIAAAEKMRVVYHHHMGTVVQTARELDRLLAAVPALQLLLDPGHLAFAGIDPVAVAKRHAARIGHVHLKSVRQAVVEQARRERWSFCQAVTQGVFTIPGDGAVDFPQLFRILAEQRYRGWLIVEAEEDPSRVPAFPKAQTARAYVRDVAGA